MQAIWIVKELLILVLFQWVRITSLMRLVEVLKLMFYNFRGDLDFYDKEVCVSFVQYFASYVEI